MGRKLVSTLIDFPKPIVAAVNGPAIGVSVTLLGLVDIVYASDLATFHTPFVSLGINPEACSSYLFPKIMGPAKVSKNVHVQQYPKVQYTRQNLTSCYRAGSVS